MSRFPTSDSIIGKALQVTPTADNAIDARSAWLFENQTGTLGTNLNGSVLYVSEVTGAAAAVKADVAVILAGVHGLLGTVTALDATDPYGSNPSYNALSNGTGYFTADGLETTVVTTVPNSPATVPTGLTVNINVVVPTTNASTPGTNYTAGPYEVTGGTAGASGLSGNITGVDAGAITGFDITDGGQGYTTGDVLTIIKAGSDNDATITLSSAPNGAVTADIEVGNNAGTNYSVGDIITVEQTGSGGNCKFCIREVQSDLPTIENAVLFTAVPAGTILPVAVDYVVETLTTATSMVACK